MWLCPEIVILVLVVDYKRFARLVFKGFVRQDTAVNDMNDAANSLTGLLWSFIEGKLCFNCHFSQIYTKAS